VFDAEADGQGHLRLGPLTVGTGLARRRGATRVVVRPEAWRLAPASGQGLAGRIESHAYEGRQSHYRVRTALGLLQVHRHHERQTLQVGAPVSVFLDGPGVSVLLAGASAMPEGP
jgi:iron(III) transport system ATP-binding protein